jgi:hypothetical protein
MLLSIVHETVLSLCESLIVFFFYTSTLDKQVITNNFDRVFKQLNDKVEVIKELIGPESLRNTMEKLRQANIVEIVNWRANNDRIKFSIILFCCSLLITTHLAIGIIYSVINVNPINILIRNLGFVFINATIEMIFAMNILSYRFI